MKAKRFGAWGIALAASLCLAAGCGSAGNQGANHTSTPVHGHAPAPAGSSVQNHHILVYPLPRGVRSTADLYNWLLDRQLAEMDNPSQGEICLDSACKVAATVFSGPAKARAGSPLALVAFQPNSRWYVLVGPLPQSGDPPRQARAFYAGLHSYPRAQGVCVVLSNEVDWYWIEAGRLQMMRQPRS
ncbi:hypothetical protein [Alicyclobacillus fructus]|uniref:hypothetical protein n=1 Tax=Alicyclobacillus fructus TaxID=2816082 RepID=UPI002E2B68BD|nr:hypothetical protein [Alicyclobacillus fructus]